MSNPGKLVNCGECVHVYNVETYASCGAIGRKPNAMLRHGPHACPHFQASPLARIATALERIAGPEPMPSVTWIEPAGDGPRPPCSCGADALFTVGDGIYCADCFAEAAVESAQKADEIRRRAITIVARRQLDDLKALFRPDDT